MSLTYFRSWRTAATLTTLSISIATAGCGQQSKDLLSSFRRTPASEKEGSEEKNVASAEKKSSSKKRKSKSDVEEAVADASSEKSSSRSKSKSPANSARPGEKSVAASAATRENVDRLRVTDSSRENTKRSRSKSPGEGAESLAQANTRSKASKSGASKRGRKAADPFLDEQVDSSVTAASAEETTPRKKSNRSKKPAVQQIEHSEELHDLASEPAAQKSAGRKRTDTGKTAKSKEWDLKEKRKTTHSAVSEELAALEEELKNPPPVKPRKSRDQNNRSVLHELAEEGEATDNEFSGLDLREENVPAQDLVHESATTSRAHQPKTARRKPNVPPMDEPIDKSEAAVDDFEAQLDAQLSDMKSPDRSSKTAAKSMDAEPEEPVEQKSLRKQPADELSEIVAEEPTAEADGDALREQFNKSWNAPASNRKPSAPADADIPEFQNRPSWQKSPSKATQRNLPTDAAEETSSHYADPFADEPREATKSARPAAIELQTPVDISTGDSLGYSGDGSSSIRQVAAVTTSQQHMKPLRGQSSQTPSQSRHETVTEPDLRESTFKRNLPLADSDPKNASRQESELELPADDSSLASGDGAPEPLVPDEEPAYWEPAESDAVISTSKSVTSVNWPLVIVGVIFTAGLASLKPWKRST